MRLLPTALLLIATVAIPAPISAQGPEIEVQATIDGLFDAMRSGDAAAAAKLFRPDARLQSVSDQNGAALVRTDQASAFVEAIGTPRTEVWDERISGLEIRVDDGLATAWMRYSFYVDDTFSHCGVNAFQLVRGAEGWQILQITDTRRREDCNGSS